MKKPNVHLKWINAYLDELEESGDLKKQFIRILTSGEDLKEYLNHIEISRILWNKENPEDKRYL